MGWHRKIRSVFLLPLKINNNAFRVGFFGIISIVIISILSSFLTPYNPETYLKFPSLLQPSVDHLFGTDDFGRDVAAQVFPAIKNSMFISALAAFLGLGIGIVVGFCCGYFRNPLATIGLSWFADAFLTIPSLPFVILAIGLVQKMDLTLMALILAVFNWAGVSRAIKAQALSIRERDYIQTLILSNAGRLEIFKDIAFSLSPYITASFISAMGVTLAAETGISILGLSQTQRTLGTIIFFAAVQRAGITNGWWWWWSPPIVFLAMILLLLFLTYMGYEEFVNPRLRGRG